MKLYKVIELQSAQAVCSGLSSEVSMTELRPGEYCVYCIFSANFVSAGAILLLTPFVLLSQGHYRKTCVIFRIFALRNAAEFIA
jgi:VIT1/CCC1 family predicted Fe2+/Mn2+ transporter